MAAPSLATKNQTNISIGLINWYCYLPNIKYNGTWATNYPEAHDPRTLELASQAGVVYLMDAAAKAAVQAINKRADILPYTTVNIKRFTDCGEWWPTVDRDFAGLTSGYAMSAMGINDIGEKHKDVIGVMGQQYSSVAKGTAEVLADYKIPYCAIASAAPSLSNKDKFPYFFRLISSSGLGNYLNLLLQGWKVKRMAILSQSDDLMSSGFTSDISKSMKANGIEVVATINLKGRLTHDMVLYAKTALLRSEARYIYISGQVDFVSKLFFSLAIEEMVGYKYVYIAMNTPSIITSDISLLSPKLAVVNHNLTLMTPMTQGFVSVVSYSELNMNSSWMQPFYDEWNKTTRIDPEILDGYWMNSAANLTMYWPVTRAFDCVMMLLLGFDKLMKQNPKYTPQELSTRALSKSLNYSQFLHLNYDALTTYPLALNPSGDYTTAFYFASYNGTTFPGASNASGNPFVQIPFAGTDVDGTILAFYNDSLPVFYGGSNIAPPDGPPIPIITFWSNSLGSSNGQGILALLITGLLISGSTLAFFVNFREAKQLKMTSVPECIVTIIGSAFCYISLAFYLNSSSTTKCVARIWLVMMGYAFMMIPVIMKNVRLYIILKSKKRLDAAQLTMINRIVISIGILIQLALLGYWASSTKNTPQSITVGTDSFNVCNSLNIGGNRSIQILTAYSVLIHVLLAVMAFMLKDVDPMFNESPALSSIFALVGLLVGVMNILPSNPSPKVDLIECVCIWLSVTITLVLLFASKMYDVLFEQIAEKGLLGLSIKSSFEGSRNANSQLGSKSGFNAGGGTKSRAGIFSSGTVMSSMHGNNSKQDSSQAQSQATSEQEKSNSGITSSVIKSTAIGRSKSNREAVGTSRGGLNSLKKVTSIHDVKSKRRPCHCKPITGGVQVFKIKTTKGQVFWNVWNGGICYFNNIRKRTWLSIATLDKVYTITIMSTAKVVRVAGTNQISISDFPSFGYQVIIEFKDDKSLASFLNDFANHMAYMLGQE